MNTRGPSNQLTDQLTLITEETSRSQSTQRERYVFEHQTCAMCDTELKISHEINRSELKVKEEAHCPCCGIRVRSSHHLMQ